MVIARDRNERGTGMGTSCAVVGGISPGEQSGEKRRLKSGAKRLDLSRRDGKIFVQAPDLIVDQELEFDRTFQPVCFPDPLVGAGIFQSDPLVPAEPRFGAAANIQGVAHADVGIRRDPGCGGVAFSPVRSCRPAGRGMRGCGDCSASRFLDVFVPAAGGAFALRCRGAGR